jgi:FlaA1/EpsC-like NDP-sugar epimerase
MARNLIRLSGLVPDEDIKLEFVGLRPGEKLFEELIGAREAVQPSSIQRVFEVVGDDARANGWLRAELRRMERSAKAGESSEVMRSLRRIIPEFTGRPWDVVPEATGKLRTVAVAVPLMAARRSSRGATVPTA